MSAYRSTGVRVWVALRLVVPDENTVPVHANLDYTPSDPYAVHVVFHTGLSGEDDAGHGDVSWSFSRELLTEGLYRQTGIGDVKVWPWAGRSKQSLGLALSSPDGYALFEVPRAPVEDFLARSYALVPAGEEAERLDMDRALEAMLRAPDADAR